MFGFDVTDYETLLVFLGVFIMTFVYYKRTIDDDDYDVNGARLRRPPAIRSFPFVGSLPSLPAVDRLHIWFLDNRPKYGGIVGFKLGRKYSVVLQCREAINEAFLKRSIDFASRPFVHSLTLYNPGLHGIIDRPYDDEFKKYHQLALTILREFGFGKGIMENRINSELEELTTDIKQLNSNPFDPHSLITSSVMNVITSILFGQRFKRNDPTQDELIAYVHKFLSDSQRTVVVDAFPLLRFVPKLKRCLAQSKSTHDHLLSILRSKIDDCLTSRKTGVSFVSRFCEIEGQDYDRMELLYTVRDLCIAGTETSATTLRWALVLVANNREAQLSMQKEVDSVVTGHRLPSLDDRIRLPRVEAFLLEVMRYKTILPISVPRQTLRDTEVCGYFIPAKTLVFPNLYAVHMDPHFWREPSTFKPKRFLDDDGQVIHKDQIISFSLGKRSCLGEILARQEIFLFFTGLLQHFDIRPPEGQDTIDCQEVVGVTVAPSPFNIRLIPRIK